MKKKIALLAAALLLMPCAAHASKNYKTKKGESLATIAQKFHVSTTELKSVNNLQGNKIRKGSVLLIPVATTKPSKGGHTAKTGTDSYKVKRHDTLPKIAKRTGISMAELRRLNGLKGNRITIGQTLVLKKAIEEAVAPKATPHFRTVAALDLAQKDDVIADDFGVSRNLEVEFGVPMAVNTENAKIKDLKKNAFSLLGTRYVFGGNTLAGLDCSSFVQHVFRKLSISMPRTAREQFTVGEVVNTGDLQKGDLVFFQTYATFPSHVGIYLGNNKMIHASSRNKRVIVSTFGTPYYMSRFIGAKRIAQINSKMFDLSDLTAETELEGHEDALDEELPGQLSMRDL